MALFVGLDVSLKTTSICVVEADGSLVWEGKAESEPTSLIKALTRWRDAITLVGIEACPLSERVYGALVECGFQTVCIETRHAQRFLSEARTGQKQFAATIVTRRAETLCGSGRERMCATRA